MQKQKSTKSTVPGTRGKTSEGDAYAVLVGDVLQSTRFPDQKALFNGLRQQFEWVNERVAAVQPLRFTVGDEFQAAYSDVVSAFRAVLLLRLKFRTMKPAIDQVLFRMDRTDVEITLAMLTGRSGNRVGAHLLTSAGVETVPARSGHPHVMALLHRLLGRRRSWMLLAQVGVGLSVVALAWSDPVQTPWATAAAAASSISRPVRKRSSRRSRMSAEIGSSGMRPSVSIVFFIIAIIATPGAPAGRRRSVSTTASTTAAPRPD